ncbi:MAG: TIM barrel protein, partial [Planctomycetaceae bacterium]
MFFVIGSGPGMAAGQKPKSQAAADAAVTSKPVTKATPSAQGIFARKKLVAWCIVPFDGKQRGPVERAAMCARLGLKRIAYDWREEHVPTFEQEILEYRKHGLEYFAFWGVHEEAFRLFDKYNLHPQIWQMLASPDAKTQEQRVVQAAQQILPLVERTRKMGCRLGLYNHGGWAGEPANLVAVCRYLRKHHDAQHVGIVYNQHHAHSHINDFAQVVANLKPFLHCLNLNGMTRDGDKRGRKILPLGEGEFDVALLKIIRDSGYRGPIGIIGHTQDDVEQRLQDNLDGLDWILPQLDGRPPGPKPKLRTWSPRQAAATKPISGTVLAGRPEYRVAPLTVECRVTLPSRGNYNIILASDTKQSGAHWELFSMTQTGTLTLYTPGLKPDHTPSQSMICDGKPHLIGMVYEANRVRLF